MMNVIQSALSGLFGASKKAEAAAANIANMHSTGRIDGTAPAPYQAVTTIQQSRQEGGVKTEIIPKDPPFIPTYSPNSPFADNTGLVGTPAVNLVEETVNLSRAETAYKANLTILRTADDMQDELLKSFDRKA